MQCTREAKDEEVPVVDMRKLMGKDSGKLALVHGVGQGSGHDYAG